MAKPILRLGPLDDLDDEFDPLLGRSVRDEPAALAPGPAAPLDPDHSVFDEPDPVMEDIWLDEAAPAPPKPVAQTDQPSLLDWMEDKPLDPETTPDRLFGAELLPETEADGLAEPGLVPEERPTLETDEDLEQPEPKTPEPELDTTEAPTVEPLIEPFLEPEPLAATPAPLSEDIEAEAMLEQSVAVNSDKEVLDPPAQTSDLEPDIWQETPTSEPEPEPINVTAPFGSTAQAAKRVEEPKEPSRAAQRRATMKRSPIGRRKAAQKLAATVAGTALFAITLFFSLISFLAPFGYPFDAVSSYRWYWTLLALAAGLSWAVIRGRNMMIASAVVGAINLAVIVPSLGAGPKGGQISNAVVAWANVSGDDKALEKVLREAERQKAGLVLIAEAPQSILRPPPGWNVIEEPNFADPTSIAVLSRGRWQSSTIPGEPTIARTAAGDLTIIATLPPPSNGGQGDGAARESQLNRAAVRAGDQDGPVAVLGDFGVAPWDGAMSQFRKYGNVTRVRCGGYMGTTVSQAFGLIGVAHDHAYVRDVKVTHCRLGGALPSGGHRAIYLYLAPLDAAK